MLKVDAHQHFWFYDPHRDSWISEEMAMLRRDFLPDDLQPHLQETGVDGCVAVQADQSAKETLFLVRLAAEYPFIKGVVGWVDLQAADIDLQLEQYRWFPIIKGFRHILQGEKDRALILRPPFQKGIASLEEVGYTYDILIYPDQLPFVTELVMMHPGQKFVLDHLGKPAIKAGTTEGWVKNIQVLTSQPNVYCKLSGMVTEADWKDWRRDDFRRVLDTVVAAFGTKRLMWGSDWPVCLLAASYNETLELVEDYFSSFSKSEQEAIFGGNAVQFYNL